MSPAIVLSNAQIADRLASLAQLLAAQNENPYKVKAYQRAAMILRTLSDSLDDLVRTGADLTQFPAIGEAIAAAIREIVLTGCLSKLEELRAHASPELADLSAHPRLDPKRILRVYKKLGIATVPELRARLDSGEIERVLGARMAQHVSRGLVDSHALLLYRADDLRRSVEEFLLGPCHVKRAEVAGECRRRVEVVDELTFVIETNAFPAVVERVERYGGHTPVIESTEDRAVFALSAGIELRLQSATAADWGLALLANTGSAAHLRKLAAVTGGMRALRAVATFPTEAALYRHYGLAYIEPELREGHDEIRRAAAGTLPTLVARQDICGELHAHSYASDGSNSIEDMAVVARELGYEYLGITDHSQSLKIASGVPAADLLQQLRFIDRLNGRLGGIRVLKSAEVDILADGSLDYPDEILRELDYSVCSIHSRFALNRAQQTERILRAMDNRYFHILGHATGRLLLKRPGYEIDIERVIEHARQTRCFFEINSSPDRLDLSADHARAAAAAGVMIAISTDAHSTREFGLIRCGIDQARRAGLEKSSILNCHPWSKLQPLLKK